MYENIFQVGSLYLLRSFKACGHKIIDHFIGGIERNNFAFIHNGNAILE